MPTIRKSVKFDETVAVAYTFDGSVYDRTSMSVAFLGPVEVAELIAMRLEMNDALRRLARTNHLVSKDSSLHGTRSLLTTKLNMLSMATAGKTKQPPRVLSTTSSLAAATEHRAAEIWKGKQMKTLSIGHSEGFGAVSMTRLAVIGSPTRSNHLTGVGSVKSSSFDSESLLGCGYATPGLCSAPSSPSADSVSSITSTYYDGSRMHDEHGGSRHARRKISLSSDAPLVPDWIMMLGGGQDQDTGVPQSSWFMDEPITMNSNKVKRKQQDFGPIGSLRPRGRMSLDNLCETKFDSEYSQFGGSSGYLYNFYKCQSANEGNRGQGLYN
ncbi:hypothetical protein BJ741DRAFT_17718 [Chytriomyces cf. hyalinus JEL632]|nr:hypothetical protein BJ741DRAFT_17718 [Chytriomyces cf. hyalinus JEL632]